MSEFITHDLSNTMFGKVDMVEGGGGKVHGKMKISKILEKKLPGRLLINPQNVFYGALNVEDTPIAKVYGKIEQDSYIRREQPNINYGQDKLLHIADDTVVFLDYNFSANTFPLYEAENEKGAFLRIHFDRALHEEVRGIVYMVIEDWYEDAITFNNQPQTRIITEFRTPVNHAGWYDIPLGDIFEGFDKRKPFKFSIAFKIYDTEEYSWTQSKQGNIQLAPELYYTYDYIPPALRIKKLDGVVSVRLDDDVKLPGSIIVDSAYGLGKMPGKIVIPKFDREDQKFYGKIFTIQRPIYDKLEGTINIPLFDGKEKFKGNIYVKEIGIKKLGGKLNVPLFEAEDKLQGIIAVQTSKDKKMQGVLNVPLFEDSASLSGNIQIKEARVDKLTGKLNIPIFESNTKLKGTIFVEKYEYARLGGTINIPLFESLSKMNGTVQVQEMFRDTMEGTINVPLFEGSESFNGKIYIPKQPVIKMKGTIRVGNKRKKTYVYLM